MIRREIDLGDGKARWLLVSQIEHARLSALFAEHCWVHFGKSSASGVENLHFGQLRQELLQAIAHHDDGWRQWESRPRIDPERHCPLSFRELPLKESLANWDGSIQGAAEIGSLAAWVVAGHFAALLQKSERDHDPQESAQWLSKTAERRADWLAEWQALNPADNTRQIADEALVWLQAFDLMSLWICSVCPAGGEAVSQWPQGYHIGPGEVLDTQIAPDPSADNSERGTVTIDPWRFDVSELEIEATAHVVRVRDYASTDDLLSAYSPHQLRWRLTPLDG